MAHFRKTASVLLLVALAGCAPQTPYERYTSGEVMRNYPYRAGASGAQTQRAITDCQVSAAQRVPQQLLVQTTPTYVTPTQTQCNRYGTQTICNTTGGQIMGGQTYTSDANAGLRARVYAQCMADKGFRAVDLPACPVGTPLTATFTAPTLAPLARSSCYIVTPDGRTMIGNRGA
ncbi:hypothetical protein DL237_13540 [Pseudooceanicola sediminis]|uniref:Uncharacterized protein n=1 Tax=Pseudooceanicola sediminis TaxID=2211117 RepID=A0A399J2W0_9RHOB|nr:hypothetical protein [Pseudooceanicola sediminis]KAA2316112.1 hypothetical protein E0K93_04465 [Puniceibacterium sp. HSS470]RII38222.1 hypothetical protein DL237_13540 [Pseudooceanicola sediminis]|tara:strand:- start:15642 stop:16166 length:525 start_codon:yes stop_codon:yes gene_type:complete